MIPKIIHYCWFGKSRKSKLFKKCVSSWRKNFPDYRFIEWNETNCDIDNSCNFVKQAYNEKKWAYVSDYFRLTALYNYGGIYLDTDVEVLKPFNEFLDKDFFCCFESKGYICTAILGCAKENGLVKEFLNKYQVMDFKMIPNSKLLYELMFNDKDIDINKNIHLSQNEIVYSSDYFSPKDYYTKKIKLTENTYAIHHFDGTWKGSKIKLKDNVQNLLIRLLGKRNYFTLKDKIRRKK